MSRYPSTKHQTYCRRVRRAAGWRRSGKRTAGASESKLRTAQLLPVGPAMSVDCPALLTFVLRQVSNRHAAAERTAWLRPLQNTLATFLVSRRTLAHGAECMGVVRSGGLSRRMPELELGGSDMRSLSHGGSPSTISTPRIGHACPYLVLSGHPRHVTCKR